MTAAPLTPPALLRELQQLEVQLHQPATRSAPARLDELLHPTFTEIGRSGTTYSRAAILALLVRETQETAPTLVHSQDFAVRMLAEGVALLTYRSAHVHAGELTRHTCRASIWASSPLGWQMLFHQGTPTTPFPRSPGGARRPDSPTAPATRSSAMPIVYRRATEADTVAIATFDEFGGSRPEEISAGHCIVACCGEAVVGYASCEPRGLLGQPLLTFLCVQAEHRRSGIATALVQHVKDTAQGRQLIASTEDWCGPMHRIFDKLGWQRVGQVAAINKDGSVEVFYATPLGEPPVPPAPPPSQ